MFASWGIIRLVAAPSGSRYRLHRQHLSLLFAFSMRFNWIEIVVSRNPPNGKIWRQKHIVDNKHFMKFIEPHTHTRISFRKKRKKKQNRVYINRNWIHTKLRGPMLCHHIAISCSSKKKKKGTHTNLLQPECPSFWVGASIRRIFFFQFQFMWGSVWNCCENQKLINCNAIDWRYRRSGLCVRVRVHFSMNKARSNRSWI